MSQSAPPRPTPTPAAARPADLTVNKVLAGAGAAATSAVLGSFFGAAGTVVGAALGSVASTVATVVYQRSLDRTQETLVSRFRPDTAPPEGAPDEGTADEGTADEEPPEEDAAAPRPTPNRGRPRWGVWIAATVVVFALGLAAVTGIEWVKGSSLTTGREGTSVSRVLAPSTGSGDDGPQGSVAATTSAPSDTTTATTATPDPNADSTAAATPQPSASARPSSTPSPTSSAVPGLSDSPDGRP